MKLAEFVENIKGAADAFQKVHEDSGSHYATADQTGWFWLREFQHWCAEEHKNMDDPLPWPTGTPEDAPEG